MRLSHLVATCVCMLALNLPQLALQPLAAAPIAITIVETFDEETETGRYDVTNSSTSGLFAFAVENETSTDVDTERGGWSAALVDRDDWEQTGGLFGALGTEWFVDTSLLLD